MRDETNRRPRIALFTDSEVFAGTERHIVDLGQALRAHDCGIALIGPPNGILAKQFQSLGIEVIGLRNRGTPDVSDVLTVARLLRSGSVEVIHVHNGRSALICSMAIRLAGRGKLVATQHFLEPNRSGRRGVKAVLSRWAHRWIERRVDRFVAISHAVRARMLARGDCADEKIVVIPNGIVPPEGAGSEAVRRVRAELGIAPDVPLVVCASRLQPEKNIPGLIEALARVRETLPNVVCVIAGEGDQERSIRSRIDELKLSTAVRLLGFRPDVLDVIAAGDLFVLPSSVEGFGLVLVEAMALGKAVVSTAAGGPLEIVENGVTGLLVPPGESTALADAISSLLSDSPRRQTMGNLGNARFLQHFTADRMAQQMMELYENVIGAKAADRPQDRPKFVANAGRTI